MKIIGNIIWIIFGGLEIAIGYFIAGLVLCVTIIGIPFGLQVFKLGMVALWPFGTLISSNENMNGCLTVLMNIIWLIVGGLWLAIIHVALGLVFCVTIIGIPFGLQHFKLAGVALLPFGRQIVYMD